MAMVAQATSPAEASEAAEASTPFFTPQRIRILGIVAAVVVVVGAVVWFTITAGRRKEVYAASALEQARAAAAEGNMGVAVEGYTRVTKTYAGTGPAYEAYIGIALARLVSDQNELAISALLDFQKTNPPTLYQSPASTLLGTAYENTGKFAEAEAAYRKAADVAQFDYLKATNLLSAARAALLAGKPDVAKSTYQEVISKYAKTGSATEAQVRLAEMTGGTNP